MHRLVRKSSILHKPDNTHRGSRRKTTEKEHLHASPDVSLYLFLRDVPSLSLALRLFLPSRGLAIGYQPRFQDAEREQDTEHDDAAAPKRGIHCSLLSRQDVREEWDNPAKEVAGTDNHGGQNGAIGLIS
jgi:hypothetical protein